MATDHRELGLLQGLIKDGRPLLTWTALALVVAGGFAVFLSASGQFLPHDIAFLGLTAEQLQAVARGRVVFFMFHDRVAFGGALVAIGVLYLWLVEFPLGRGEAWAWWTLALSGLVGFASFLTYLGYGYLDTWHGAGTLVLLPLFLVGLIRSYGCLRSPKSLRTSFRPVGNLAWPSWATLGRLLLLATGAGMVLGGSTIMGVGITSVFVPQDLVFIGSDPGTLAVASPRLIPLIAHDRAGFGGAICCGGLIVLACAWCAPLSRSLWQAFALAGLAGFGAAIGVHFIVGYTDFSHLAPAYLGSAASLAGLLAAGLGARQPSTVYPTAAPSPKGTL